MNLREGRVKNGSQIKWQNLHLELSSGRVYGLWNNIDYAGCLGPLACLCRRPFAYAAALGLASGDLVCHKGEVRRDHQSRLVGFYSGGQNIPNNALSPTGTKNGDKVFLAICGKLQHGFLGFATEFGVRAVEPLPKEFEEGGFGEFGGWGDGWHDILFEKSTKGGS